MLCEPYLKGLTRENVVLPVRRREAYNSKPVLGIMVSQEYAEPRREASQSSAEDPVSDDDRQIPTQSDT